MRLVAGTAEVEAAGVAGGAGEAVLGEGWLAGCAAGG